MPAGEDVEVVDVTAAVTERLAALPDDLALTVRAGEAALRGRGVAAKSAEHVAEVVALVDAAEKEQAKRSQQVVLTVNTAARAAWGKAATGEERHALLSALTDGRVDSAKKVSADQLKSLRLLAGRVQDGAVVLDVCLDGSIAIRDTEQAAS
jgi:hypothetical protein